MCGKVRIFLYIKKQQDNTDVIIIIIYSIVVIWNKQKNYSIDKIACFSIPWPKKHFFQVMEKKSSIKRKKITISDAYDFIVTIFPKKGKKLIAT